MSYSIPMECILCGTPFRQLPALPWANARDGKIYFRCVTCELVWMAPEQRPAPAEERSRYLEHRNESEDEAYLRYLARLADPVCALISPGARGIDYGCGPAQGMRTLLEPRGYTVLSYDPIFFPQDPEAAAPFDFLLCNEAAEHFFAPAAEFARMDAIVDRGGILAFSSGLVRDREAFLNWRYRTDPTHVIYFNNTTLEWIGRRFGWELLSVENPRFYFRKK